MESSQIARPYFPDRRLQVGTLQMPSNSTAGGFELDEQFRWSTNRYLLQGHPGASLASANTALASDPTRQPILLEPLLPSPTPGNPLLYGNNSYPQDVFQELPLPTGLPAYPPSFETSTTDHNRTDMSDPDPMFHLINDHLDAECRLKSTHVNELNFATAAPTTCLSSQGLSYAPEDASPPPTLTRDPTLTPSAAEVQSPYTSAPAGPWDLPYLPNNHDTWLWEQGIDPSAIVRDAQASFSQDSRSKRPVFFGGSKERGMLAANPGTFPRSYHRPEPQSVGNQLFPQRAVEAAVDTDPSTAPLPKCVRNRETVSWLPGQTIGEPQPMALNQSFQGIAAESLQELNRPEIFAEPLGDPLQPVQEVKEPAGPDSPRCPALERPIVPQARKRERYKQENEVIVWLRDVKGLTFKQIADEFYLIFGERKREPTLRGRYRNATKPPHERVRNPKVKWGELAINDMRNFISHFQQTARRKRNGQIPEVPWKKCAEHIRNKGGYCFGAQAVKKKWEEEVKFHAQMQHLAAF